MTSPVDQEPARSAANVSAPTAYAPITKDTIIDTRSESAVITTYKERREASEARRLAVQKRWNLVANVRLAGFVLLAAATWFALRGGEAAMWLLAGTLLVGVIALVAWHARLRRERDRLTRLVELNDLALARLDLAWDRLPEPPGSGVTPDHPYARDLDVVGATSLARRISTPVLMPGWDTLHAWLLALSDPETIVRRQEAVHELAPALDLRQGVEATGRQLAGEIPDPEPFLAWTDEPPWLLHRPWLWALAIISPLALVVLAALFYAGVVALPLWLAPLAVNVILFQVVGKQVSEDVARAAPVQQAIAGYAGVFRLIGAHRAQAPLLREIGETLGGEAGATGRMRRLARIGGFVIPRGSILWVPLQIALLWDVHVLHALERWRAHRGNQTRAWFARAGEWEALAALAVLAHDHPGWNFPTVETARDRIDARGLAHPLIHHGEAVANDVSVGPTGTFLFVTGSNMSGKSTLLRAIGLNAVLAQAGGPVAATSLAMPPLDPWTCMRVEDSLAHGVSFFMAELQRLKTVVDAALAARERPVLYLLDEIMQGTNTAERQIASRQVLAQLTECNAVGSVSSHDLTLIEGSGLEGRAVAVHFAETFTRGPDGPQMTFDYRLQPGIATTTNALALMELLGFDLGAVEYGF